MAINVTFTETHLLILLAFILGSLFAGRFLLSIFSVPGIALAYLFKNFQRNVSDDGEQSLGSPLMSFLRLLFIGVVLLFLVRAFYYSNGAIGDSGASFPQVKITSNPVNTPINESPQNSSVKQFNRPTPKQRPKNQEPKDGPDLHTPGPNNSRSRPVEPGSISISIMSTSEDMPAPTFDSSFYLQVTASGSLTGIVEKARQIRGSLGKATVMVCLGEVKSDKEPHKLLLGPFESKAAVNNFKAQHIELVGTSAFSRHAEKLDVIKIPASNKN